MEAAGEAMGPSFRSGSITGSPAELVASGREARYAGSR